MFQNSHRLGSWFVCVGWGLVWWFYHKSSGTMVGGLGCGEGKKGEEGIPLIFVPELS